jgi:hypothetical protein
VEWLNSSWFSSLSIKLLVLGKERFFLNCEHNRLIEVTKE